MIVALQQSALGGPAMVLVGLEPKNPFRTAAPGFGAPVGRPAARPRPVSEPLLRFIKAAIGTSGTLAQ
jgi:hypothetical protein